MTPTATATNKRCTKCLRVQPLANFYVRKDRPGTPERPARQSHCRTCVHERERAYALRCAEGYR